MSFADLIARAVRDPMTQGNPGEMHRLLDMVEALPARLGVPAAAVHGLFAVVGAGVREALAPIREEEALQALIRRGCGLEPDPAAVSALWPVPARQAIVATAAGRAGLEPGAVAELLPVVVPAVLKVLDAGSGVRHGERRPNAVLHAFLADGPDMGECVRQLGAMRQRAAAAAG